MIGAGVRASEITPNLPATCRIVAICNVELPKAESTKQKFQRDWKVYQDYRQLLDKESVEGVVLCNCDHNRILPAIHACQASKDIYVEKPFSLYVTEGRALVNAVRRYTRICQTGTQSRTIGTNQAALRMIREGKLGKLKTIVCRNYSSAGTYPGGPQQPIPSGLAWDNWCGQTELLPYNEAPHRHWSSFNNYCGGAVTLRLDHVTVAEALECLRRGRAAAIHQSLEADPRLAAALDRVLQTGGPAAAPSPTLGEVVESWGITGQDGSARGNQP